MEQDYIRTARAKGLSEQRVVRGHAFRNALIPIVTVVGLELGGMLGGAVVTETVFSWPGVGKLTADAIAARDYQVTQGVVSAAGPVFVVDQPDRRSVLRRRSIRGSGTADERSRYRSRSAPDHPSSTAIGAAHRA